jgi:hypothetical protein
MAKLWYRDPVTDQWIPLVSTGDAGAEPYVGTSAPEFYAAGMVWIEPIAPNLITAGWGANATQWRLNFGFGYDSVALTTLGGGVVRLTGPASKGLARAQYDASGWQDGDAIHVEFDVRKVTGEVRVSQSFVVSGKLAEVQDEEQTISLTSMHKAPQEFGIELLGGATCEVFGIRVFNVTHGDAKTHVYSTDHDMWIPVTASSGGGVKEVWVDAEQPVDPNIEIWVDTDDDSGGGLTLEQADLRYVNVDGDSMTGTLRTPRLEVTADASGHANALAVASPTGDSALTLARDGWGWVAQVVSLGADAGDVRFRLWRKDYASATDALRISNQTGLIEIVGSPTTNLGIATKGYVDGKILNTSAGSETDRAMSVNASKAYANGRVINSMSPGSITDQAPSQNAVSTALAGKVNETGDTMSGQLTNTAQLGFEVQNAADPRIRFHKPGVSFQTIGLGSNNRMQVKDGGFGNLVQLQVATPSVAEDAATKAYADEMAGKGTVECAYAPDWGAYAAAKVTRVGQIVIFSALFRRTGAALTTGRNVNNVLCTVPVGYRPAELANQIALVLTNRADPEAWAMGRVSFETSGTVQMMCNPSVTINTDAWIVLNASWRTA